MACECVTGKRVLRLTADSLRRDFSVFYEMASPRRWEVVEGGAASGNDDAVLGYIGGDSAFDSLQTLTNFLRTMLPEERVSSLRAAWVPGGEHAGKGSGCANGCASGLPSEKALYGGERLLVRMSPLDTTTLVRILQEKQIETWYQPVFRARTHELWGHECLMRARDEDGKLLSPAELIAGAVQERLTFMLDRVCRETHIENAARMLPGDSNVLINFLPTAIYDPGFCLQSTRAACRRFGLDAARVIFEVVETDKVDDFEHLRAILDFYKRSGFRTALDDVGSGYAGLTMLAELNPSLIKIARELVSKAASSEPHRIICNAIRDIGTQSGQLVLAEGIETEEEYAVMRSIGVDLVQGYLFGRPAPDPAMACELRSVPAPDTVLSAAGR